MENRTHLISGRDAVDSSDVATWTLPEGAIARLGRGREPDIAFSPDGQYISIGNSLGLWVYDLETLSPIALWETERGMVFHVAISPNGKCIAASNSDKILKVLDIQNGACLTQVEIDDYISGLTFSPDNQYIAAAYANSSTVEIWYAETCEPLSKFTSDIEKAGFYRPISFSPDTQLIASTCSAATTDGADSIIVWNMESGEQIACLSGHTYWVTSLCFSPCGKFLASGGEDGTVCVWDVNTWQQVQCYTDYGDVYRIMPSWTPDGILRAAIVHYDETGPTTISVRDLESDEQLYIDQTWGQTATEFFSIFEWGNNVVFSNGTQLAYECRHEFINVWTSDNPVKRQFTHSPISFPTSMVFSQDGKTLAVQHHQEGVVLWNIESKRSRPAIKEASAGKNQFVYKTVNGKLHAASIKDDTVTLWEADGDEISLIEGTGREYWSAFPALAPTGTLFAYAGADGNIQVWDVQNGKKLYELTHPLELSDDDDDEDDGDSIRELEFSYNGKLLASESKYRNVRLWDMELGEEIDTFPSDSVTGFRFSPCGQYLVCFGIEEILIWDITHRKLCKDKKIFYDLTVDEIGARLSLPRKYEGMHAKTFSSCENYFAAGAWWKEGMQKMRICLWEVETGKHIVTFWGHPTDVHALAFSPDNKLLASTSYDGTILLWDLTPYI